MTGTDMKLLRRARPQSIAIAILVAGTLGLFDAVWLTEPDGHGMPMWFNAGLWAFLPSVGYFSRFALWRVLPVSSADRRRAQWWVWLGLPLAWVFLGMSGGLLALAPFGRVHASALAITAALGAQVLLEVALVAVFLIGASLRRRPGWRAAAPLLTVVLVIAVLGVALVRSPDRVVLAVMGGVALALALMAYAAADAIGRVLQGMGEAGEPAAAPAASEPGGRTRGWAAMWPYAAAAVGLAAGAGAAVGYWSPMVIRPSSTPVQMIVLIMVIWAVGGSGALRAVRVLRALPVGPAALTVILQGFMLAATGACFAAIWGVFNLTGNDMAGASVFFVAAIPVLALQLPLNLRFGGPRAAWLALAPLVLITMVRLLPAAAWPLVTIAGLGLTAVVWGWTWWELAWGRAAYRQQPAGLARWRGRGG